MNKFYITGSKALLYAFAEETNTPLSGLTTSGTVAYTSDNTLVPTPIRLPPPSWLPVFILPMDWGKAIGYVKEYSKRPKSKYSNGDLVIVYGIFGKANGNGIQAVTFFARLMPIELKDSLEASGMLDGDFIVYFEGEYFCITENQIERKATEDEIAVHTKELEFGDSCKADIDFEKDVVRVKDETDTRGSLSFNACKEAFILIKNTQTCFNNEYNTIESFYDINPCLRFNFGCVFGVTYEEIKKVMRYIY